MTLGDPISYRQGVTVTDNSGETPRLTIDSSQVDLSTPGAYSVSYTAVDSSGNKTTLTITVTVLEQEATSTPSPVPSRSVDPPK